MLTLPLVFGLGEVPRLPDAGAQLAHARERKLAMIGRDGPDRERARGAAVEAYRAVREHHPRARAAIAEAAFRAGELLRAAERFDEARVEFRVAVAEGRGTEFRVRGRLELGHVARRAGEPGRALDEYLAVLTDEGACGHQRDEALLWIGRVHADRERDDEARRAWRRVAADGADPVTRVRAFDELGCLWIRRGDLEAAAGEWNRCRVALADVALERTERGERVRSAMKAMKTLRRLREAVRRREEHEREREERRGKNAPAPERGG